MSSSSTNSNRPLSPHLSVYKLIPTMAMSIAHRITGVGLYIGTILVAIWLAAAASGPGAYNAVMGVYGSWFGLLVLFAYTWTLMHHMLGGIRHFIWDTGSMMEKHTSTKMAWATLAGSITLTVLIWLVALAF